MMPLVRTIPREGAMSRSTVPANTNTNSTTSNGRKTEAGWQDAWEVTRLRQELEASMDTLMRLRSDIAAAEVRVDDLNRDARVTERPIDAEHPQGPLTGSHDSAAVIAQHVATLRDANHVNDRIVSLNAEGSALEAARVALVSDHHASRHAHAQRMESLRAQLRAAQFHQRSAAMLLEDRLQRVAFVAASNAQREAAFQKRMEALHAFAPTNRGHPLGGASDDSDARQGSPGERGLLTSSTALGDPSMRYLQASVDQARDRLTTCEKEVEALRTEVAALEEVSRVRVELVLSNELEAKREQLVTTLRAMKEALRAATEQRSSLQRSLDAAEGAVHAERQRVLEEQRTAKDSGAMSASLEDGDASGARDATQWRHRYLDQLDVLRRKLQATRQATKEAQHRQLATRSKVKAVLPTQVMGAREAKVGSQTTAAGSLADMREQLRRQSAHLVSVNGLVEDARRKREALDANTLHIEGVIERHRTALVAMEGMMASFKSSMGSL